MNRDRVSQGALKYFMLTAVVSTLGFGAMILADRPEHRRESTLGEDASKARGPSQIDERSRPFLADVKCWDALARIEIPAGKHYVRLTGKFCKTPPKSIDVLQVSNATNAFVATIFPAGAAFTTDLIPLHDGANDLVIKLPRGRDFEVAHIQVTR